MDSSLSAMQFHTPHMGNSENQQQLLMADAEEEAQGVAHHRCRSRSSSQSRSLHGDATASLWPNKSEFEANANVCARRNANECEMEQWRGKEGASAASRAERSRRLSVTGLTERTAAAARPGKKGGDAVE